MSTKAKLLLLFAACVCSAFVAFSSAFVPARASAHFSVEKGEGISEIAARLYNAGIIKSRVGFLTYAVLTGAYDNILPGTYELQSFSFQGILTALTRRPQEVEVVIFPGMTLKEADDRLTQARVISAGSLASLDPESLIPQYPFLKGATSLEGFVMPDTYRFYQASEAHAVAGIFLDNFKKKIAPSLEGMSPTQARRVLVIASLIEKEVITDVDKGIVSGIIARRLEENMYLQLDASVLYGVCEGRYLSCRGLVRDDFEKDTPYNTYTRKGIPVGPISNPSLSSVQAALSPVRTAYLYYLTDPRTKKTVFSKTFVDHNEKRANYLGL